MEYYYRLLLYVLFGVLPSLIWLIYYLRKDLHPEPKRMILKVFICGAIATIPVFFIEVALAEVLRQLQHTTVLFYLPLVVDILKWFIVIALVEELFKYAVFRLVVLKSTAIDEPIDIMLYMVVAALGFAALENIFYLFSPVDNVSLEVIVRTTVTISFIRFVGATFLHTLTSAALGYFLILYLHASGGKRKFLGFGLLSATLLHGLYNFSIITLKAPFNFVIPIAILTALAIFIIAEFEKMKKVENVCKVENTGDEQPLLAPTLDKNVAVNN